LFVAFLGFKYLTRHGNLQLRPMSALQAIRKFRLHELQYLPRHIARFGPLQQVGPEHPDTEATVTLPNPFLPRRHPKTGKWSAPKYSLRRQSELVKKAKESNTLHLLPPGPKLCRPGVFADALKLKPAFKGDVGANEQREGREDLVGAWMNPVAWEGKFEEKVVAGADIGTRLYASKKRMFKGHKWERMKEAREKKKKILMRDMLRRVNNYKTVRFIIILQHLKCVSMSY